MNSPGNIALTSLKPINGSIIQSPVRATFENSKYSAVHRSSQVISSNKDMLPPLGLPPTGKRHRNDNYLPNISTMKPENSHHDNLKYAAS